MQKGKSYTSVIQKDKYKTINFDIVIPYDIKYLDIEEIKVIILYLYNNNFYTKNLNSIHDIVENIRINHIINREILENCFYDNNLLNRRIYGTLSYNISDYDFVVWQYNFQTQKFFKKEKEIKETNIMSYSL